MVVYLGRLYCFHTKPATACWLCIKYNYLKWCHRPEILIRVLTTMHLRAPLIKRFSTNFDDDDFIFVRIILHAKWLYHLSSHESIMSWARARFTQSKRGDPKLFCHFDKYTMSMIICFSFFLICYFISVLFFHYFIFYFSFSLCCYFIIKSRLQNNNKRAILISKTSVLLLWVLYKGNVGIGQVSFSLEILELKLIVQRCSSISTRKDWIFFRLQRLVTTLC